MSEQGNVTMSVDYYRRQVTQHQTNIVKFSGERSKAVTKAAQARKKALNAEAAASKTKSASTAASKRREAQRYAAEEAKAMGTLRGVEGKLASEQKKLLVAEKQLGQAQANETKKQHSAQLRAEREQERALQSIHTNLHRHERIHTETTLELEKLKALPEEIVVAFFAADPGSTNDNKLALDEEVRSIGKMIRASKHRDSVRLESRWAVRPLDIIQAVNELRPTVVHFSGHGSDDDELILQDDLGASKYIPKQAIVQTLALTSDSVELVFFNTCFSFNQAQECVQHINAAIGMNRAVNDDTARIFASQFYSSIGFGLSIPKAFDQAKALLMMENIEQASIPELYLKEGISEEELILVQPR